jgi:predicted NBD/HSP70 family sugar kinase
MAGEFGHMPFGRPSQLCRCGAYGCWNTALDGRALAGQLGHVVDDPELVCLSGLAPSLRAVARDEVEQAYRHGLMSSRAQPPLPWWTGASETELR